MLTDYVFSIEMKFFKMIFYVSESNPLQLTGDTGDPKFANYGCYGFMLILKTSLRLWI